jgi:hypothetical protein
MRTATARPALRRETGETDPRALRAHQELKPAKQNAAIRAELPSRPDIAKIAQPDVNDRRSCTGVD